MNSWIFILWAALLLFLTLSFYFKGKKIPKDPFSLEEMTVIEECSKCAKKVQRIFKKGDFVGKVIEECKCGGRLRITKIFFEKISEEESKWQKVIKPFE